MKKQNMAIILAVLIIAGIGVGVYGMDQQAQVKKHLVAANDAHNELIALNDDIKTATTVAEMQAIDRDAQTLLMKERTELLAAKNIFATSAQNKYISAALNLNDINAKLVSVREEGIVVIDLTRLSELVKESKDLQVQMNDAVAQIDSVVKQSPNDFGFTPTRN